LQLQHEGVLAAKGIRQQDAVHLRLRLTVARRGQGIGPMGRDTGLEIFRPSHVRAPVHLEVEAALGLEPLPSDCLIRRVGDGLRANTGIGWDARLEHQRRWAHDEC